MQADNVVAGGVLFFVRRWLSPGGRPVLLWHGGGGASTEFPPLAAVLPAAGHSLYVPDAPGYGESPPLDSPRYRPSVVAELACALIDVLEIAPVVWIGSSWGASIGVQVAVRTPARVAALALLDGGYLDPNDDPEFDPSLDLPTRTAQLFALAEQGESWDAPPEVIARIMEDADSEPVPPLLPALHATGIPVLLVRSTEPVDAEPIRLAALKRFCGAVPDATVVDFPAQHALLAEAGERVAVIVRDWMEGLA